MVIDFQYIDAVRSLPLSSARTERILGGTAAALLRIQGLRPSTYCLAALVRFAST